MTATAPIDDLDVAVTLPARRFATAWTNVTLAASQDPERHPIYRAVAIDTWDACSDVARLTATDSYWLATCLVGPDDDDIFDFRGQELADPTVEADRTFIVVDPDQRARPLTSWLLKATKGDDELPVERRLTVELRLRSGEDDVQPTLDPSLDQLHLVIDAGDETLALPVVDGEYPAWRRFFTDHQPADTRQVAFGGSIAGQVAKFKDSTGILELTFAGALGAARFRVHGDPMVDGIIMPTRPAYPLAADDDGERAA